MRLYLWDVGEIGQFTSSWLNGLFTNRTKESSAELVLLEYPLEHCKRNRFNSAFFFFFLTTNEER